MTSFNSDPQLDKLLAKLNELEQLVRSSGEHADSARSDLIGMKSPVPPVEEQAGDGRRGGAGGWLWRLFTGQR
jgi:hypothetical protein